MRVLDCHRCLSVQSSNFTTISLKTLSWHCRLPIQRNWRIFSITSSESTTFDSWQLSSTCFILSLIESARTCATRDDLYRLDAFTPGLCILKHRVLLFLDQYTIRTNLKETIESRFSESDRTECDNWSQRSTTTQSMRSLHHNHRWNPYDAWRCVSGGFRFTSSLIEVWWTYTNVKWSRFGHVLACVDDVICLFSFVTFDEKTSVMFDREMFRRSVVIEGSISILEKYKKRERRCRSVEQPSEKICDYNRLKSRNPMDQIWLTIRLKWNKILIKIRLKSDYILIIISKKSIPDDLQSIWRRFSSD